jgi:hypothetical protein
MRKGGRYLWRWTPVNSPDLTECGVEHQYTQPVFNARGGQKDRRRCTCMRGRNQLHRITDEKGIDISCNFSLPRQSRLPDYFTLNRDAHGMCSVVYETLGKCWWKNTHERITGRRTNLVSPDKGSRQLIEMILRSRRCSRGFRLLAALPCTFLFVAALTLLLEWKSSYSTKPYKVSGELIPCSAQPESALWAATLGCFERER